MKHLYLFSLTLFTFSITCMKLKGQIFEDFESLSGGDISFAQSGISFIISSNSGEAYNVFEHGYFDMLGTDDCQNCGWNGTSVDQQFIDNTLQQNGSGNGTNMIISTGGSPFTLHSFYLFCSTILATPHSGDLSIIGSLGGQIQYQFSKSSGFADVTTLNPNNGFTFIDLATEGITDHSQTLIDEISITGSGDLDYMALDGLTWNTATFSTSDRLTQKVNIYPIPAKTHLYVEGIPSNEKFVIMDLLGKKVMHGDLLKGSSVDIQELPEGVYLIKFAGGNVRKLIKD